MLIALHSLATMHCNLLTGIQIARETGYAGIEISGAKLKRTERRRLVMRHQRRTKKARA